MRSRGPNQERAIYPIDGWALSDADCCPEGYRLRPHVVWFGEPVPMVEAAIDIIAKADVVIIIGTSLRVYPAAGLIHYIPSGAKTFCIDPNSETFQLPNGFELISKTAVEGMALVFEKLTSSTVP